MKPSTVVERGCRRAGYVTPDLSCYWEGGREYSATIKNGMEKTFAAAAINNTEYQIVG